MYRADEIEDPKHAELRENVEKAITELLQYEEDKEAPGSGERPANVELVVRSMVAAEVMTTGEQVSILMFTSTGDVATWNAAGMAQMMLSYATATGWESQD